jgi:hypothetical protein
MNIITVIVILVVLYLAFRLAQLLLYLNFKIHVIQKIIYTKFNASDPITDTDISRAVDYVLNNDYEHKFTLSAIKWASRNKYFDTTDGLNDWNLEDAFKRIK